MLGRWVRGGAVPRQRDRVAGVASDLVGPGQAPFESPGESAVQHHALQLFTLHEEELLSSPAASDLRVVHEGEFL